MKQFFWCLFFTFSITSTFSQTNFDVRSNGLGKVQSLSENLGNPSYLSFLYQKKISFAVNNYFEIKELNAFSIYTIIPNKFLDFGISATDFHFQDFHFLTFKTGFSKKISPKFSLGTNLYMEKTITGSDHDFKTIVRTDLGMLFKANDQLDFVILGKDLVNNTNDDQLQIFAGCNYKPLPSCALLLEISYEDHGLYNLSAGIEYEFVNSFFLRTGIIAKPFSPTFGASYSHESLMFDFSIDKHQQLGHSMALGISYQF